jgi:hypothetical protein
MELAWSTIAWQRPAGFVDEPAAFGNPGNAVLDEGLDLLRGRRAAPGEAAHFRCDHREPAALVAGARRFDSRVQREQVCWNAIESMTPMMSAIFAEAELIPLIAFTAELTTSPPVSCVRRCARFRSTLRP